MADTLSLAGKTALVTGSGRENGIGSGIARAFARNGAAVAIHYVSESSKPRAEKFAQDLTKEFGTKTTVVQGAIEDPNAAPNIVKQALVGLAAEHIDILVNNAGYGGMLTLLQATPGEVEKTFGVNTYGTIYMTQAVVGVGRMPKGGRIINISSISSKLSMESVAIYAAAKAAQDSLTTTWAGELGKSHGITVNALAPGPIVTDMAGPMLMEANGSRTAAAQQLINMTRAAGRIGTIEDTADAALLLVSEKSRWITGAYISVSGGITGAM